MYLQKLYLQDFRQFANHTWDFIPKINIIIAPNGAGKTTILEAIDLLSRGKSFRAGKTAELLKFGTELARAYGLLDDQTRLGATLTGGILGGVKAPIKSFTINKAKRSSLKFVGNLLTACFRPEDLRLIEGSSSRRRDYLDAPLTLTSDVYRQASKNYHQALVRRNKTLTAIREGELTLDALTFWNEQLLQLSEIITTARTKYLEFVNTQIQVLNQFTITYDHSHCTRERLAKYQAAEIAAGHSLIGPHKDDFDILYQFPETNTAAKQSLLTYGSRGQHRLAVLWLKMAELNYLRTQTENQPILLLDDICSELDEQAKQLVRQLAKRQQTIITTTEENVLELGGKSAHIIRLEHDD